LRKNPGAALQDNLSIRLYTALAVSMIACGAASAATPRTGPADLGLDLSDADSITEIVKRVAVRAATLKHGEWLLGRGWDEGKLAELRYVHAADLDVVTPDNPVWCEHTTGHYGVANSAALKLAGITASSADPPAGTIDRDVKGQPTGVLKEAALNLVDRLIPEPLRSSVRQPSCIWSRSCIARG
jgi:predicted amidohydrolase YtcJ